MADNYLERKYDEYLERKAAAEKAKRAAWKKRMDAYRKKLAGSSGQTHQAGNGQEAALSEDSGTISR